MGDLTPEELEMAATADNKKPLPRPYRPGENQDEEAK